MRGLTAKLWMTDFGGRGCWHVIGRLDRTFLYLKLRLSLHKVHRAFSIQKVHESELEKTFSEVAL